LNKFPKSYGFSVHQFLNLPLIGNLCRFYKDQLPDKISNCFSKAFRINNPNLSDYYCDFFGAHNRPIIRWFGLILSQKDIDNLGLTEVQTMMILSGEKILISTKQSELFDKYIDELTITVDNYIYKNILDESGVRLIGK
jgi:hypothetical protein